MSNGVFITTYHFIVDFMEMNLTYFIDDIFALKRDESET